MSAINIFWYRRDLRIEDNAGLYYALKQDLPVLPVFIFDTQILDELPKHDLRVSFIHDTVLQLNKAFNQLGSTIDVRYGKPIEVWQNLLNDYTIQNVYTNRDYEAYAIDRDEAVSTLLAKSGIGFHTYKDHVIFERQEVVKDDGNPYTVFTPFSRKWRDKLNSRGKDIASYYLKAYPTEKYTRGLFSTPAKEVISLETMGFKYSDGQIPDAQVPSSLITNYESKRNFPAIKGTSRLGLHFRFGTISIRQKCKKALGLSHTFVNELIWRDFYSMILQHFPHVARGAFRPQYDLIDWVNNEHDFEKWKSGNTGYPIVDAGMRELNATGFMHNRVRMITASFLTKHLLIDWKWGEAYFAEKLLDFDLASNNGGWQWAAGSGTDAAPYFRIFNPTSQQEKFDKNYEYVKKWVPEFGTANYPRPMIDHKLARERCLSKYKAALKP